MPSHAYLCVHVAIMLGAPSLLWELERHCAVEAERFKWGGHARLGWWPSWKHHQSSRITSDGGRRNTDAHANACGNCPDIGGSWECCGATVDTQECREFAGECCS